MAVECGTSPAAAVTDVEQDGGTFLWDLAYESSQN